MSNILVRSSALQQDVEGSLALWPDFKILDLLDHRLDERLSVVVAAAVGYTLNQGNQLVELGLFALWMLDDDRQRWTVDRGVLIT